MAVTRGMRVEVRFSKGMGGDRIYALVKLIYRSCVRYVKLQAWIEFHRSFFRSGAVVII